MQRGTERSTMIWSIRCVDFGTTDEWPSSLVRHICKLSVVHLQYSDLQTTPWKRLVYTSLSLLIVLYLSMVILSVQSHYYTIINYKSNRMTIRLMISRPTEHTAWPTLYVIEQHYITCPQGLPPQPWELLGLNEWMEPKILCCPKWGCLSKDTTLMSMKTKLVFKEQFMVPSQKSLVT